VALTPNVVPCARFRLSICVADEGHAVGPGRRRLVKLTDLDAGKEIRRFYFNFNSAMNEIVRDQRDPGSGMVGEFCVAIPRG